MGIKTTAYPNSQTTFDDSDEFDVSAYVSPGTYESRKYTWATLKAKVIALIGQIWPTGTTGQTIKKGSSAWVATSDIFVSSGSDVGIGTTTPGARLNVSKSINGVDPIVIFTNSRNTGTTFIASVALIGTGEVGTVSSLGYANQYGETDDAFLKADKTKYGNVNVVAGGENTEYTGAVRFYPDGVQPNHNTHAPLEVQGTDGKLIWKEMITNGMAYTDGFKITNKVTATKSATGDYLEIQIAGITRYIPLFN